MNEAGFSTNFHVYNGDGMPMQFTIRGNDFEEFERNLRVFFDRYTQLGSVDLLLREQPENSVRALRFRVIGWIRGDTKDKYDPNKIRPCVYLYANMPHLEYAAATVYEEKLFMLPPEVDWRNARSVGNMAPMVAMAKNQMEKCDFEILMEPQFDVTGALQKNKNGKVSYRFSRVISGNDSGESDSHDVDFGSGSNNKTAESVAKTEKSLSKSPQDELMAFVRAFGSSNVQMSKNLTALCNRLRELDRSSGRKMSVARVENGEHKQGRYNFLCGILDTLAGENVHDRVLSFLLGRVVNSDANNLPGDALSVFIEEIWPGSSKKTNEKFNADVQSIVKEAIHLCSAIELTRDLRLP